MALITVFFNIWQRLSRWQQRAHQRRRLRSLSTDMRKDLGLSTCDAAREADKPFWES